MRSNCIIIFLFAFLGLLYPHYLSAIDHGQFITGTFCSGEDVTRFCIKCHRKEAEDFIKTPHWRWKGPPRLVEGLEDTGQEYGKINLINNFCISIQGGPDWQNVESCSRCHPSYGFKDKNFDFNDITKIDCLICHEQSGFYHRGSAGKLEFAVKGYDERLLKRAVASVGKPTRKNCGACHFFGGGGDGVKHGDLDSSLINPSRRLDVHMGTDGLNMVCQDCHRTKNHRISGASTLLATYDGRVYCENCHGHAPHNDEDKSGHILNKHAIRVACQSCHIPYFARELPTKLYWDWSAVGQDLHPPEQFGKETYLKHKGLFRWGKNVIPEYAWYKGKIKRYLKGETIDTRRGILFISKPLGSRDDDVSKIYPFKIHRGRQPLDSVYKYLLIPHLHNGLWSHYNWERALIDGTKGSGLPFSGKYEFVSTAYYGSINHQVAPKEQALKCKDCHYNSRRIRWNALGYKEDPALRMRTHLK